MRKYPVHRLLPQAKRFHILILVVQCMVTIIGPFRHPMALCNRKVAVEPPIMSPFFGIALELARLVLVVTGNFWPQKVLPLIAPASPPLHLLLPILQIPAATRQLPEHQTRLPELTGTGRQHQRALPKAF